MNNKIIVGNWKMKLSLAQSRELINDYKNEFKDFDGGEAVICPNFLSLPEARKSLENINVKIGAQNVFWEESGSFTGEISAPMLLEAGCEYVILGHSERRNYLLENYEMIHKKVRTVLSVGNLVPIICIGEQAEDRKSEKRDFILINQLQQALAGINIMPNERIIVAYEPVWAIGSGVAIEPEEAEYAHKIIRLSLHDMFGMKTVNTSIRIVYGGSINSKNVGEFKNLENTDGLLIGGASLDAREFRKIAEEVL